MADGWEAVLDRLEADLDAAERMLGEHAIAEHDAGGPARVGGPPAVVRWVPPEGLGPLPAHLAERASALAAAQEEVTAGLAQARSMTAHHLAALRAVPPARHQRPVYLDVEG